MGNRIARIQNDTPWLISIMEHRLVGTTWEYGRNPPVQVVSNGKTEIPASLFLERNHQSGMPSEIVIFAGRADLRQSLISQHFTRYVKIVFCVEGRYLVVKGVRPQCFDLNWFWGCGFLGREYRGRQGVTIIRSSIAALLIKDPHLMQARGGNS